MWFSDKISIPGLPKLPAGMVTTIWPEVNVRHPWMAPGTAPVTSACGKNPYGPGDGKDLPPTPRTSWPQGGTVQAAWAIYQNHGGGYQYRLCPSSQPLTEECFQQHPLPFADDVTTVHWTDGREQEIKAKTTSTGTSPAGSQWRRNPIPTDEGGAIMAPPCTGCKGGLNDFSLVDRLTVPKSLAPGNYVLSWRWDCEVTAQTWLNCGDITIAAGEENQTVVV